MSGGVMGLFKAMVNPTNLMLAATGPGGIAAAVGKTLVSAVGQELIQRLGDKLGLPQSMIDSAQSAFCATCGDQRGVARNIREAQSALTEQLGLSPFQAGNAGRELGSILNKLVAGLSESAEFKAAKSSGGKAGQSWLMALASVLGEKLNAKAAEVQKLAGEITDKTPDKTAKFGAATQEFGILMNAANNAIKTLGEGLTTTARKG